MISRADVQIINRTRSILKRITDKTGSSPGRNFPEGKLGEAATAADRALSNVLTIAHVHTDSQVEASDIHGGGV